MSKVKVLSNVDLGKNQLLNAAIENRDSEPTNAVEGQLYYNTLDKNIYRYNGSDWVNSTTGVGDVKVDGISVVSSGVAYIDSAEFGKVQDVIVNGESVLDSEGNAIVTVPTKTSDLTNDGDGNNPFVTTAYHDSTKQDKLTVNPETTTQTLTGLTIDGTNYQIEGGVTSITAGTGLTGGTITSTGTIAVDTTIVATKQDLASKQDNIEDLETIRTGANLGATSIQPNDNISELNNDANYSSVNASYTGSSTTKVKYITIDGVEKKLAGGYTIMVM